MTSITSLHTATAVEWWSATVVEPQTMFQDSLTNTNRTSERSLPLTFKVWLRNTPHYIQTINY